MWSEALQQLLKTNNDFLCFRHYLTDQIFELFVHFDSQSRKVSTFHNEKNVYNSQYLFEDLLLTCNTNNFASAFSVEDN